MNSIHLEKRTVKERARARGLSYSAKYNDKTRVFAEKSGAKVGVRVQEQDLYQDNRTTRTRASSSAYSGVYDI